MNNRILIIVGILVVAILVGVWVYLMLFGTPKNADDIFADLGIGGGDDTGVTVPPPIIVPEEEPVVNLERPRLRQLTTRPVIGFTEAIPTATGPSAVIYAEAGTGHVYQINLTSGEETRLLNVTIAEAAKAVFSPDGATVAIRSHNTKRSGDLTILSLLNSSEETVPEVGFDFTLFSSTSVGYTTKTETGLQVLSRSLDTNKVSALFTIPFYEATISWGTSTAATHVVYPKPSYALEGYLYTFSGGKMGRLPAAGFGMTAMNTANHILYTNTTEYVPRSIVHAKATQDEASLPFVVIPEKCAEDRERAEIIWCAHETVKLPYEYPDEWYQGLLSFRDSLWQINLDIQTAELVVDTFKESGRAIDVSGLESGRSGSALYFTNKNDNTLWMYEL
jgi:hypothetical protein